MYILPPDTGASIKTAPIFSAAAAISFETDGSMVLESISREPFFIFLLKKVNELEPDISVKSNDVHIERENQCVTYLRMPLGPVYTSMTLGLEGSMVIIRSALSATSPGLSTIWETKKIPKLEDSKKVNCIQIKSVWEHSPVHPALAVPCRTPGTRR